MRSTTLRLFGLVTLMLLAGCAQPTPAPTPAATIPPSPPPATITPRPTAAPTLAETPIPVSYPMRIEQVGQLGGASRLLALGDKYLYLQVGPRLAVVDISDPTLPYIVGRSEVLGEMSSITMSYGDVLVSNDSGVVWRLQIDPNGQPTLIDTYEAGDPDRPEIENLPENSVSTPDYTIEYDPRWREDFYGQPITITRNGDEIIEPFAGLPEGQLARAKNFAARGRYVYGVSSYELEIYDLALPPERPYVWSEADGIKKTVWQKVGGLDEDIGTLMYGGGMISWMGDICAAGKYLNGNGIWSLDIPEDPERLDNPPDLLYPCYSFPVKGGAISRSVRDGLYTYMVPNSDGKYTGYSVDTGVESNYAFTAWGDILVLDGPSKEGDRFSYTLYFMDIADPFNPRLLGSYAYVEGQPYLDTYQLVGPYLYFTGFNQFVMDISDPANPKQASKPPYFDFRQFTIADGQWIYNLENNRLDVLSVNDFNTPLVQMELPHPANSARFPGLSGYGGYTESYLWHTNDRLFIYANYPGEVGTALFVIDISNPLNPIILASSQMEVYQVVSYGDYLYVHQFEKGIAIYKLVPN